MFIACPALTLTRCLQMTAVAPSAAAAALAVCMESTPPDFVKSQPANHYGEFSPKLHPPACQGHTNIHLLSQNSTHLHAWSHHRLAGRHGQQLLCSDVIQGHTQSQRSTHLSSKNLPHNLHAWSHLGWLVGTEDTAEL
mgnify:CR=1 FL=1